MITRFDAIASLVGPDVSSDGGNIIYQNGQTPPSESEIDTEFTRLIAEYDALQYQRDRTYPTWQEQMDQQYWDQVNGTTTWKDAVEAVKTKWPKDNSGPVE